MMMMLFKPHKHTSSLLLLFTMMSMVSAFTVVPNTHRRHSSLVLAATVDTNAVALSPKEAVISTAKSCQDSFGLFLVDKTAKRDLAEAVEALEMTYDSTSASVSQPGTWDLICTTSTSTQGVDTKQLLPGPLQQLSDRIATAANKYVTVQQILKSSNDTIDRIDHVIAYAPPKSLTELLENVPEPLRKLQLNPLDVSKSQLILVHKVDTTGQTTTPADTTTLTLQSVIWNVAGNSTYLDPQGQDITSINLPSFATDFLASGTFTTTYQDDDLRIVRGGQQGPLELLRVFVKSTSSTPDVMDVDDIPDAEIVVDDIIAADESSTSDDDIPSDVGAAGP